MKFNDEDFKGIVTPDEVPQEEAPKKKAKKAPVTLHEKVMDEPVKTIRQLVAVTESAMAERIMVWDRYRRKYRRGLKYLQNVQSGVPLYFTNYLFANVESIKANLTRNLPKLSASPRGSRDDLASDLISRALEDTLDRGGIRVATKEVVHHGLLATMAYYKVYYSEVLDDVAVEALSPEHVLVDPKAQTLDDARWIIHRRRAVPVDAILAEFGKMPEKALESDSDSAGDSTVTERDGLYTSTGELKPSIDVTMTFDVYETWIRVYDREAENPWYIVTHAGATVLKSEFSPYEHGRSPFVVWFGGEDYGGDNIYYRGVGAIEEIEPLQDRADAVDLKIYKHISLMTNRQKFVSAQSGLNVNLMDNTSGRTLKVNGDPRNAVYYDTPPQLPMEVYNYRDRTEMLIQTVSGVFDVTQGRRPTGITAGRAIESLKDSAETRLAALADTLAYALEMVGGLSLQIMLQFFDGERLIKSTDGDKDKDFMIIADYPPEMQPQPMPMLGDMGEMLVDEETGGYQVDETEGEPEVDPQLEQLRADWKAQNNVALVLSDVTYQWDIKANADSALPSAKAERAQVATEMFRLGAIDREALLTAIEYPDRHKILQRLASEATGKNAGDPNVDGDPVGQMMEMLAQMGLPEEMLAQIAQQMQQGGGQPPQQKGFAPQMTI